MKKLVLLTNEFPYGNWEPYLETEIKYYNKFDEVIILALQLRKDHAVAKRKVGKNIKVIPIYYASKIVYLLNVFKILFDINLYKELKKLLVSKRIIKNVIDVFVYFSRSHYEANKILKVLLKENFQNCIFYSYRFEYQPYVAVLIKKKLKLNVKIITRAHGSDLYENVRKNNYIPCREILLENVDKVFPCSNNGTLYLRKKFPEYADKIKTLYLGTKDLGLYKGEIKRDSFEILSCSNMVSVKRIDKIIEALGKIENKEITWTHYGDGVLMQRIKEQARKLPSNIRVKLIGNIENKLLLENYKNKKYHVFINVSSSEGIPVSIMEANSFGIPCIATDAGGTKELIENGKNGYLLSLNFKIDDLVNAIYKFIEMPEEDYINYRFEARRIWEKKFDANKNYNDFANYLLKN